MVNLLQLLRRENSQQVPSKIKTVEDIPVIVGALSDELVLELLEEVQIQEIVGGHRLLSDNGLHGHGVLSDSVVGVELVGDFWVIASGHALADSRLHKSGQRGKHVNGRVDLLVMKLTVDEDLSFGDIPGKIWDRMVDIIIGHGQNRELGDGPVGALHSSGALVDGRQIGVHISREGASSWHLLSGGRDFLERIGVGLHIG